MNKPWKPQTSSNLNESGKIRRMRPPVRQPGKNRPGEHFLHRVNKKCFKRRKRSIVSTAAKTLSEIKTES